MLQHRPANPEPEIEPITAAPDEPPLFFRGLLIGLVLSGLLWVGLIQLVRRLFGL
jgi:hypothetical protein